MMIDCDLSKLEKESYIFQCFKNPQFMKYEKKHDIFKDILKEIFHFYL